MKYLEEEELLKLINGQTNLFKNNFKILNNHAGQINHLSN